MGYIGYMLKTMAISGFRYRKTEIVTYICDFRARQDRSQRLTGCPVYPFRFQAQCETLSPNIKNDRIDSQFQLPSFTYTRKGEHTCIDKHATRTHTVESFAPEVTFKCYNYPYVQKSVY